MQMGPLAHDMWRPLSKASCGGPPDVERGDNDDEPFLMQPNECELFALETLFSGADVLCTAIRQRRAESIVIERTPTGVGFFSTLRFPTALPETEQRHWDWNFSHAKLRHGGSLMAWRAGADIIELEGVTFGGEAWPETFVASDFLEAL